MKPIIFVCVFLALFSAGCQSISEPELAVNELETRPGFSETETDLIFDVFPTIRIMCSSLLL